MAKAKHKTQKSARRADHTARTLPAAGEQGFVAYTRRLAAQLRAARRPVAEKYECALNKFVRFLGPADVPFAALSPALLAAFEGWMRATVTRNTSSFYMRCLHAAYNRAVADSLADGVRDPFRHVYTGVDKTVKRALPLSLIRKIKDCDLAGKPKMAFARDLFLLSFYFRGMAFVDMAYLTRSCLAGGFVTYRRRKTGQTLTIRLTTKMRDIISRHAASRRGDYLLPILTTTDARQAHLQYKAGSRRVNTQLKRLGLWLGLPVKLTMYVARHSWATAAQTMHVPVGVISRGLGHDSEQTTRVYLASIDSAQVDHANDRILKALR